MTFRFILAIFILTTFANCKSVNLQKDTATDQLNNLQSGVMLIRLPTNEAKIAKLKTMGRNDLAKKESAEMAQFHTDILKTFEKHFTFCPVYYYYSDKSMEVKNGNFDGNLFDAKLNNVPALSFSKKQKFYAEFGFVHQEELTVEKDGQSVKVAGLGGKKAFVIRTHEGIQPLSPFPYTVNYYYKGDGTLTKPVQKINDQLFRAVSNLERRKLRRERRQ
ncbi:MAG: hypothetical protein ACJAT4_003094 [Granulosicoccus sp.]|jgi:hypothetical protein